MSFVIHEFQRCRIYTITLTGRWWAVIENMTEVGITMGAQQFDATAAETVIRALGDFCCIQFAVKTWPATTRVVFAARAEQGVTTTNAVIKPRLSMVAVFSAERCFGTSFAGYAVLFRIQLSLPLLLVFGDFFHSVHYCNVSLNNNWIFTT